MDLDYLKQQFYKSAYMGYQLSPKTFSAMIRTKPPITPKALGKIEKELNFSLPTSLVQLLEMSSEIDWRWNIENKFKGDPPTYLKQLSYNIGGFINWSSSHIVESYKQLQQITDFIAEDQLIHDLHREVPYTRSIDNLSIAYIKNHIKNLVPFMYIGNGDDICIHRKSEGIFYFNSDPGPGFDGYGLYALAPDIEYFLVNLAKIGFLSKLEIEYLGKIFQNALVCDKNTVFMKTSKELENVKVPDNFIHKYLKPRRFRLF